MIKIENIDVWGFEHAIRGMRNPLNSWEKSDTVRDYDSVVVGEKDLNLMKKLAASGPEHRKFLRQIFVSMDILAPLYWWKEMDQYKVGTTTDSCSTMHTITKKRFDMDDFSHEHLGIWTFNETFGDMIDNRWTESLWRTIDDLNFARALYIQTDDPDLKKQYWWQIIQLLPSSYNQKRTWTGSYENLLNIRRQRGRHKLDEWKEFCQTIEKNLPHFSEIFDSAASNI